MAEGISSHTMNRFVDTEFDHKQLPPICGYWSEKLISLEEALKFIVPNIEQLDRSIKAAKKYCHFPSKHGLTRDESAALFLYTIEGGENSFYQVLNQALRSEDRPALKPWFPYLKLLDAALSKLPTVSGCVWRGVHCDTGKDLKKHQELTWWTVTSCSLSVDVIKDFLGTEKTSTLFMIEVKHAKDISGYSNYSIEDEVLLSPGIRLRVAANPLNHGGLCLVHLIEICDDSDEQLVSSVTTIPTSPVVSKRPIEKGTFKTGKLRSIFISKSAVQNVKKEPVFYKYTEEMEQSSTTSTSMPAVKVTTKELFSEPEQRQKADLPCGGRYDYSVCM